MSQENVDLMRKFAAAFERDGMQALRDYADPEIEWHEDPAFPESGIYRGLEAVETYASQFLSEFSEIHYEPIEMIDSGDHVVTEMRIRGVGRLSGAAFDISAWWVGTISGGRLVRCFAYLDRERALEAMGLSESGS